MSFLRAAKSGDVAARAALGFAFSASGNGLLINFGGALPMDYLTNPSPLGVSAGAGVDVAGTDVFAKLVLVKPPLSGTLFYSSNYFDASSSLLSSEPIITLLK